MYNLHGFVAGQSKVIILLDGVNVSHITQILKSYSYKIKKTDVQYSAFLAKRDKISIIEEKLNNPFLC